MKKKIGYILILIISLFCAIQTMAYWDWFKSNDAININDIKDSLHAFDLAIQEIGDHVPPEKQAAAFQVLNAIYYDEYLSEEDVIDAIFFTFLYKDKLKKYLKKAKKGDAAAQFLVGYYCLRGYYNDPYESIEWFIKSAKQGNADAQYFLANCFLFGNGVQQDYEMAKMLYFESAKQGNIYAQKSFKNYSESKSIENLSLSIIIRDEFSNRRLWNILMQQEINKTRAEHQRQARQRFEITGNYDDSPISNKSYAELNKKLKAIKQKWENRVREELRYE